MAAAEGADVVPVPAVADDDVDRVVVVVDAELPPFDDNDKPVDEFGPADDPGVGGAGAGA